MIKEELSRIMKKWYEQTSSKLQSKNSIFSYEKPENQLVRVN